MIRDDKEWYSRVEEACSMVLSSASTGVFVGPTVCLCATLCWSPASDVQMNYRVKYEQPTAI